MSKGVSANALKHFASDLETYGKVCLRIRTKQAEVIPLKFNNSQRLVHDLLKEQFKRTGRIRAIILKARQQGMSTYVAARNFRKLHLWPNNQAVVVADELDRAQTLFGMYDRYATYLPDEMRPMMRYVSKKKEMVFDNPKDALRAHDPGLGSGIAVETAGDAAAGRASTTQLAHLSEMAFWPNAVDVYISLMQSIPDFGSEVIVESTANGVGNLFHQMWEQAEEGEGKTEGSNGYLAIFIPWWWHEEYELKLTAKDRHYIRETLDDLERSYVEEGIEFRGKVYKLNEGRIAWRRMTIREKLNGDERAFRQEYPSTPEEAFLVSGACFFEEDTLKALDTETKSPVRRAMLVSAPNGGVLIQASELGYLRIWERPNDKGVYVIAADTATGREVAASSSSFDDPDSERGGRDFCSADVVDVTTRQQVAQLHGRMAPEIFADQLALLGRLYSSKELTGLRRPALMAPEKNHSSGETVIERLQKKHRYPYLYRHRPVARRWTKPGETMGWVTNVETRMPMLDNLAENVRNRTIRINAKESIKEMRTFVRGEDGKPQAQEGAHDDRVISLGIAVYLMDQGGFERPKHYEETEQLAAAGSSPTGLFDY